MTDNVHTAVSNWLLELLTTQSTKQLTKTPEITSYIFFYFLPLVKKVKVDLFSACLYIFFFITNSFIFEVFVLDSFMTVFHIFVKQALEYFEDTY